ncbi:hypothetical protein LAZ67_2002588 [Cordylochernes scorpioides]|uniref:HTH psq-type domain-containing protein n=1 Tax=Cordylochernes scorpioides TaxID=51811 RepID=A0ABY6K3U0_9ARAC|nr:hypothetical protein LAZ67_2002588 [Cordylochernes scorpioides]
MFALTQLERPKRCWKTSNGKFSHIHLILRNFPQATSIVSSFKLHLGGNHFANDDEVQAEANHWLRRQDTACFSSFIFITMDRKKVCKKSSAKKKMMSIELKREIIEKNEQGVRVVDLSRQYGRSTSMICSVLKQKESIKSVTPSKGLTIISKLRTSLHENMEKLLMVWVTEKQLQGDTLTQTIICEKARAIYGTF